MFCPESQLTSIPYESRKNPFLNLRKNAAIEVKALAGLCLGHLAENPGELARFMDVAGYDAAGLRAAVDSAHLAAGLIDYFAAYEPLLLALCANNGLAPQAFMRVWHQLNPAG